ncbi:MAG: hypothetical protein ABL977_00150 [Candidatus Eisenbacteria bacterium]
MSRGGRSAQGGTTATRLTGAIALPAYTGGSAQCTVYYDNIVVTALR